MQIGRAILPELDHPARLDRCIGTLCRNLRDHFLQSRSIKSGLRMRSGNVILHILLIDVVRFKPFNGVSNGILITGIEVRIPSVAFCDSPHKIPEPWQCC